MPGGSGEEEAVVVVDLWAMAAELERQFAGYKQRLADRDGTAAAPSEHVEDDAAAAAACDDNGGGEEEDVMRGRMYEAYVRRRDERLREGWRARMERKEAEVKAFWAQLELTARAAGAPADKATGGGDPSATTTGDDGVAAGDEVGNSVTCHIYTIRKSARFISWFAVAATTRCRFFALLP